MRYAGAQSTVSPHTSMEVVIRFARDERGATAVEYALIAGSIFLAIVASVGTVAPRLAAIFGNVETNLQ